MLTCSRNSIGRSWSWAAISIEGVPAVICPRCGEAYMTADALHELGRLKANRGDLAVADDRGMFPSATIEQERFSEGCPGAPRRSGG
jgi:hypothetical protein